MTNLGTNILIFKFPQKWDPIYLFFVVFFYILGPYFLTFFESPELLLNWDHIWKILKRIGSHPWEMSWPGCGPGLLKEETAQETSCFTMVFGQSWAAWLSTWYQYIKNHIWKDNDGKKRRKTQCFLWLYALAELRSQYVLGFQPIIQSVISIHILGPCRRNHVPHSSETGYMFKTTPFR